MIRSAAALLALTLFVPLRASAQEAPTEPAKRKVSRLLIPLGPMKAVDLIDRWAKAAGKIAVTAPEVARVRLDFREAGDLSVDEARALLAFHQVIVHERGNLLLAHTRRNVYQRVQPTLAPVIAPGERLPKAERLVTAVVPIRHGDGNMIFAAVRGLLSRDNDRLGTILWVPGSSSIVIQDATHKVAYYRELIAQLDRPAAAPHLRVRVYELPRETWRALKREHSGGARLGAAVAGAVSAKTGRVLEELELSSLGGRFRSRKTVEVADRSLTLSISTRSVVPKRRGSSGHLLLELDLQIRGAARATARRVSAPLPRGGFVGRTRVSAFTLAEGDAPTQLVVVLEGRVAAEPKRPGGGSPKAPAAPPSRGASSRG